MSEYQSYEFIAVDRPLSQADQDYLNGLSSRSQVTSNSASVSTSFSSLLRPDSGGSSFIDAAYQLPPSPLLS